MVRHKAAKIYLNQQFGAHLRALVMGFEMQTVLSFRARRREVPCIYLKQSVQKAAATLAPSTRIL
jgi:hypothetical protein